MIYPVLKTITRLALKVYFKKMHIEGKENIPQKGPFLIVANHPSSFLDPASIAILVKQKISFLAKGSMFKNKLIGAALRKLNMIPIHRAQDDPKMLGANKNVFRDCFKKLANKGVIMIFPEGTSEMERRLRKIKTGTARIALGAEKENNYNLGVKILPVGLNYTKSSRFRSELTLIIGKPIDVQEYEAAHRSNEIEASKKLTDDIEKSIRELIIVIDQQESDELIERIESIYKTELIQQIDPKENKSKARIKISQGIIDAVQHFQQNDISLFENISLRIDRYYQKLEEVNLSDQNIRQNGQRKNLFIYMLKSVTKLILGFPFWLFGMINSYIPYKLPRAIALKITDSEAFYGALLMSLGTVIFVLFYSLEIFLVGYFSQSIFIIMLYAISLPLTGLFTIYYSRFARKLYFNWKLLSKFYSEGQLVAELIDERKNIIFELEQIKEKFILLNA